MEVEVLFKGTDNFVFHYFWVLGLRILKLARACKANRNCCSAIEPTRYIDHELDIVTTKLRSLNKRITSSAHIINNVLRCYILEIHHHLETS